MRFEWKWKMIPRKLFIFSGPHTGIALMHCAPHSPHHTHLSTTQSTHHTKCAPHTYTAPTHLLATCIKPTFSSEYISQCILRNEDLAAKRSNVSEQNFPTPELKIPALWGSLAVNRYRLTQEPTSSALQIPVNTFVQIFAQIDQQLGTSWFPGRASKLLWVRYFELFLDLIGFQHPSIGAFYWGDRRGLVGNLGGHWSSIKDDADASLSSPDHDPNPWRHHQPSSMETSVLLPIESWAGWHEGSSNVSDGSIG